MDIMRLVGGGGIMTGVNVNYDWFDARCNQAAKDIMNGKNDDEEKLNVLIDFIKIEGRPLNAALLEAVKVSKPWAKKLEEFPELRI